jgi:hypothetical protein
VSTVTALLTNQAYGFPTRGAQRRVTAPILACIHISGNSRTAANPDPHQPPKWSSAWTRGLHAGDCRPNSWVSTKAGQLPGPVLIGGTNLADADRLVETPLQGGAAFVGRAVLRIRVQTGVMATKDEPARYGKNPGSGSNEPKQHEKKEQRSDWIHRQGGDQTRSGDEASRPDDGGQRSAGAQSDEAQGKATRSAQEIATLPHLEGSHQGPK